MSALLWWEEKTKVMALWIARIKRIFLVRFAMEVMGRFGRDNAGLIAAGLSFFTVLTLVPLLLTAISGLGYWLELTHRTSTDAADVIQKFLTQNVLPGAAGAEVRHLMERANITETVHKIKETRGIAGIVGLLGVIWAAMQIYVNAATAMNAAWERKETRNWLKLHLVSLGLLLATGVLLIVSISATAVSAWFSRHIEFPGSTMMLSATTELGAVIVSTLMYYIVYRYLPAGPISWKGAGVAAIFSALAWEIAKKGLSAFLLRPNHSLYGGLADLIIFVLWIYYSMMILLLGAEVGSTYTVLVEDAKRTSLRRTAGATPAADTSNGGTPRTRTKIKHNEKANRTHKPDPVVQPGRRMFGD